MLFYVLWYPIGIYNPLSPLAHAVDFQDTAEGLPRSITNHLEVGELFLQLSGVALHGSLKRAQSNVRFGSMVCLLAGPAFYLRQWLHPNCSSVKHCGTFSTWLSRLKKQLKVAVLTHHFGVLPCSWLLVESFGIRPFVWFSIVLSHYLEIAQVVLQKNISRSSNTSWGLPVSLTTTSSSCFPRTFRTAGGCWT